MDKTKAPKLPFVLFQDGLPQMFMADGSYLTNEDVQHVLNLAKKRCVQTYCEETKFQASGIRIGAGKILTCWHLKQAYGKTITVDDVPAEILHESEKEDLLLLKCENDNLPQVTIATAKEIDPVFWVGNPLRKSCLITQCSVMGVRDKRIYISHQVQAGSSGSGLYLYTGELVGMIFEDKGKPKTGTIACARSAAVLKKFLEQQRHQFSLTG